MGHLPMLQPRRCGAGSCSGTGDTIPTLVQTSVHTCTAIHTFAVGYSKPSAAVPYVAINKHGTEWLQPGQVPAPLCLLSFLG